ncbi:putative phosphosugar-binding protein [Texcoconibacillus texcoconensis]|uniref:Putative phosphosugar-binding protein n=1 Tax=Texcoconibacillus texcoconensis TaxID=1095777 RepID=A0A840QS07_9BACI|nr:putative phosphosugar-binding protein [Texcoconibacillus texcoconensis]
MIDNLSEKGDAVLKHESVAALFATTSTVLGVSIVQSLMADTIRQLVERGIEPPVLRSGNIDGADEYNQSLIDPYKERIPLLSLQ